MGRTLTVLTICFTASAGVLARDAAQSGALTSQMQRLQTEVLISNLASSDLDREIAAENGVIEHMSEVARGGPVTAVVRTSGCQKVGDMCTVNADIVVYSPDGSVFHEAKNLDLPQGRIAVPLKVDANTPTGVYRVVATIRDLAARRFAKVERQFGVK
jgi:hypothetical protein